MAFFKVNVTRIAPGQYQLSYGRGSRKVVALVASDGKNHWYIGSDQPGGPIALGALGDIKIAWAARAENIYNGAPAATPPLTFHKEIAQGDQSQDADPEPDLSEPNRIETPLDALELCVGWARRNRRDLNTPPWCDAVKQLRKAGRYQEPAANAA